MRTINDIQDLSFSTPDVDKPLTILYSEFTLVKKNVLMELGNQSFYLISAPAYKRISIATAFPMNPEIIIISRAQLKSSVIKLKTAGADHVILPELADSKFPIIV